MARPSYADMGFCSTHPYLRVFEMWLDHLTDVLSVWYVQGSIHLIQDVQWGRFKQQHGQDQGQGYKRPEIMKIKYVLMVYSIHVTEMHTYAPVHQGI